MVSATIASKEEHPETPKASIIPSSLSAFASFANKAANHSFIIGQDEFLLDGKPFQIRCGEIHAARVPREYWRHRLQMIRAMGLNTVCAYLFWNLHEPRPNSFNWTEEADAVEFCRIAQEEGLWVILRPGPYACAEWEMGGLPWWLLKQPDIRLRTRDPHFIGPASNYLREIGRRLAPHQITHGGPILMVQVENEYGFFGRDAEYMGVIRQSLIDGGFNVPLFACNPVSQLKETYRADLFPVVNFGTDPVTAFNALREILPRGPLMCGEFYPGWFDTWGAPHHTGKTEAYLRDLNQMLEMKASFSIYMAHGGTTFGLWSGADRPFKPDTSSYDYDAPISEAGWTTEKFFQTRELLAKHLLPDEFLPAVPAHNRTTSFPRITLTHCAAIFANLSSPFFDERPSSMENHDQGFGSILYRIQLPPGPAARIEAAAIHDFGYVFLNGERIAITDRRSAGNSFDLPARTQSSTLDILVEAMGRVNFGIEVHDRKGLIGPVFLRNEKGEPQKLTGWSVFSLPLDAPFLKALRYVESHQLNVPAFWKGSFHVDVPADVFVDLTECGKGVLWINGKCVGRFWNIGPTQTAYAPGPWLKAGENEVIVLDYLGANVPAITGRDLPILNQLRPDLDFNRRRRAAVTLKLSQNSPVHRGSFQSGSVSQTIMLGHPMQGRFFGLRMLNAQDDKPFAAIAELTLLDTKGDPLSSQGWKIAYIDSEESIQEDGIAENAIDGQISNYWHSQWSETAPGFPHLLVLDLGLSQELAGIRYTPRQGEGDVTGRIKDYEIYLGNDLILVPPP